MNIINMADKNQTTHTVETGVLRKNLSDILESVKHHELRRVNVSKHKKIQASVVPSDQADLLYDLSLEEIEKMNEALGEFIDKCRASKRGKKSRFDLGAIVGK